MTLSDLLAKPVHVSRKNFQRGRLSLRGLSKAQRAKIKAEFGGATRTPPKERRCQGYPSAAHV